MQINLNNKKHNLNKAILLKDLLIELNISPDNVVITLNDKIIEQNEFDKILLKNNDNLELFSFVGGG
jgi:thiamine biosynthesis protein ThiS